VPRMIRNVMQAALPTRGSDGIAKAGKDNRRAPRRAFSAGDRGQNVESFR